VSAILAWFTGTRVGRWVALLGAALVGLLAVYARGRSDGADGVLDDQRDEYIKRREEGIAAARDADERGRAMTPEEQLAEIRKNGGEW
jgi:hypothetical protein